MTRDPWALPIAYHSIMVKRDAVARKFPGGVEEFECVHPVYSKNGGLFLIARLTQSETEPVLERLNAAGIIPGRDVAVCAVSEGELLHCPGVRIWQMGPQAGEGGWFANVADTAPQAPFPPPAKHHVPTAPTSLKPLRTSSPRRVVGSLVHHIYDDEDEDEEVYDRLGVAGQGIGGSPPPPTHTITLDYGYDCHSIEVDTATFETMLGGECVYLDGQGFWHEEAGLRSDRWYIDLSNRCAGFTLDNGADFGGLWINLEDEDATIQLRAGY